MNEAPTPTTNESPLGQKAKALMAMVDEIRSVQADIGELRKGLTVAVNELKAEGHDPKPIRAALRLYAEMQNTGTAAFAEKYRAREDAFNQLIGRDPGEV